MNQIAIPYAELKKHLQQLDLEESKVSMIETECPSCGRTSRITVQDNGVRHRKSSYCYNAKSCPRTYYKIIGNITAVYTKQEVDAS